MSPGDANASPYRICRHLHNQPNRAFISNMELAALDSLDES